MDRLALFLEIYDSLTPENRDLLVAILEEAVHNQEASADSPQSTKETKN